MKKEEEAYANSIRIKKEVVWEARKRNILPIEEPTKEKKCKLEVFSPKPKETKSFTPSSGSQKEASTTKSLVKPSGKGEKRKKEKFVTVKDDEEIELAIKRAPRHPKPLRTSPPVVRSPVRRQKLNLSNLACQLEM